MPDRNKHILPYLTSAAAFGDPAIVVNPNFAVLYLNKSAQKLLSVEKEKPKDLYFEKLVDLKEGDKSRLLAEGNKSRSKKRTLRFNIINRKNNSLIPVDVNTLKVNSDGMIYYLFRVFDVSDRVNTIDKLRAEKKNMELLKTIAIAANNASRFDVAVRYSLNKICEATGWHIGHAFSINGNEMADSMQIWTQGVDLPISLFKKKSEMTKFSTETGLPGRIFKSKKAEWIEDITKIEPYLRSKEAKKAGIRSAVAFPIKTGDKVSAIFEFYSQERIVFDKKLMELLENIGIILGRVAEREVAKDKLSKAYNTLKETQAKLIQNERLAAIGKFSAGLAHEIRNPLANILAAVQYMLKKYASEAHLKQNLEIIERNGKSASRIIQEMLSYASPAEIKLENGSISDVITDVAEMIKHRCEENNIRLVKKVSKDIPNGVPQIKLNAPKLQEAFLNFAANAIDAMKDGGTLTISCNQVDDDVVVKIKDTGIGIPEEDLDKIFEPFYTQKDGGTGLGVGLASNIVLAHKGDVRILSNVGEGTVIYVTLPVNKK